MAHLLVAAAMLHKTQLLSSRFGSAKLTRKRCAVYCVLTLAWCLYVSGFEKRYNFVQIDDFELVYCFASAVNELHVALHFASLAASVAEISSLKVQNFGQCVFA